MGRPNRLRDQSYYFLFGLLGLAAISLVLTSFSKNLNAHALQPGYLELGLLEKDLYSVIWKVPVVGSRPMAISAKLPDRCDKSSPGQLIWDGSAYVTRWTTQCKGGLEGGVIEIEGLDKTSTDVLVRFDFSDGASETHRLTSDQSSFTVPEIPGSFEVVRTYFILGAEHILSGIDHLLFVLALLLLVKNTRMLVATITAFTLAHSITLAGATLGYIVLPAPPVEAIIALSIVFVASEIIRSRQGHSSLTQQYPWIIAFAFGLLHGFGFAGALADIGLPRNAIPSALLFFNIGVEVGQLIFVALVMSCFWLARQLARNTNYTQPTWAPMIAPYLIGGIAAFWVIERFSTF